MNDEKLFTEFPPVTTEQWEATINKDLKGADYEKKLVWRTDEGFQVRPYYRAENLQDLDYLKTMPNEFPYTRGTKARDNHWDIVQEVEEADPAKANAIATDALKRGATCIAFNAANIDSDAALTTLLKDIDLNVNGVQFNHVKSFLDLMKNFVAYVEAHHFDKEKVSGSINFQYDPDHSIYPTSVTNVYKTNNGYATDYKTYQDHSSYHTPTSTNYYKDVSALYDTNGINLYGDGSRQHTLTVYYLERGSLESNCEISFNLQVSDSLEVKNTYDDTNVGEYFKKAAKKAADKEAVQYVMASDSRTSVIDSPDLDVIINKPIQRDTYYTVKFDTKESSTGTDHGSFDDVEVKAGDSVTLPATGTTYDGHRLKGWDLSPGRDSSSPLKGTYTPTAAQVNVDNEVTLYAVYEEIPPAPFDAPPPPILLYGKVKTDNSTSLNHVNKSDYTVDNCFVVNMTSLISPDSGWGNYVELNLPSGQRGVMRRRGRRCSWSAMRV